MNNYTEFFKQSYSSMFIKIMKKLPKSAEETLIYSTKFINVRQKNIFILFGNLVI